jgi:hypothetical protein
MLPVGADVRRRSGLRPNHDVSGRLTGARHRARAGASGPVGGRAARAFRCRALLGRGGIGGRVRDGRGRALGGRCRRRHGSGSRRFHRGRGLDRRRPLGRGRRIGGVRREEGQRVEVSLRVGRRANAEVDVRRRQLRVPRRADRAYDRAFGHGRPAFHLERPEVEQRDRLRRRRLDRDRPAASRNRPRERDDALGRGENRGSQSGRHVDAPMLPAGVRLSAIEVEPAQDLTVDRPGPRAR